MGFYCLLCDLESCLAKKKRKRERKIIFFPHVLAFGHRKNTKKKNIVTGSCLHLHLNAFDP